jgi:hypothetical protein
LLLDDSASRTARELWWTNQEFSLVNIIPSQFSMLIYHLGHKQWAHWWPQFRDVVSSHQHDHHQVGGKTYIYSTEMMMLSMLLKLLSHRSCSNSSTEVIIEVLANCLSRMAGKSY